MGHFGSTAIIKALITNGTTWTNFRQDVTQHVAACLPCQRYNIGKHGFHPLTTISAKLPFDHVAMDLKQLPTFRAGFNYILVPVYVCTRFVFLRPLKNKDMVTLAVTLLEIFLDVGFPKIIQSDNGTEFVNQLVTTICQTASIDARLISAYHARANGLAERFVQTISQSILKLLNGRIDNWDQQVRPVQYYKNGKIGALHNSTPFALLFARPMNAFYDYRNATSELLSTDDLLARVQYLNDIVYPAVNDKARKKQADDIAKFTEKHKSKTLDLSHFIPGSLVMVRDELRLDKVSPRYEGPFEVVRRNRGGSYLLKGTDGTTYSRPACALKLVYQQPVDALPSDHVEVETILDHRPNSSSATDNSEYLVKWKGRSATLNQWVPASDFDGPALIAAYFKNLNRRVNSPRKVRKLD
jgi:transposase InsO family protein